MSVKLITPPASEPVELDEVKLHLRVDHVDDNSLISDMIAAARGYAEQLSARVYITQTWELYLDKFPDSDTIEIPKPPLQSITSVEYRKADGTWATVDAGDYGIDTISEPGRIRLLNGKSWTSAVLYALNAVRITFVAGYGESVAVPENYRSAIKLLVGHLYENREEYVTERGIMLSVKMPLGAHRLLMIDRAKKWS